MASAVAQPRRTAVSRPSRARLDDVEQLQGSTQITLPIQSSRNIDAPHKMFGDDPKAARDLPQNMRVNPSYQEGKYGGPKVLYMSLNSPIMRAVRRDEYAGNVIAQTGLDGQRRGAGAGLGAESSGARVARIHGHWRAGGWD